MPLRLLDRKYTPNNAINVKIKQGQQKKIINYYNVIMSFTCLSIGVMVIRLLI